MQPEDKTETNGIRLVLVLSQAEEAERLRERWAAREPSFRLLTAPSLAKALPYLSQWQADAVVCDLRILSAEAAAGLLNPASLAERIPLVALVSPGMEQHAVALLAQGLAECVVKAGNYDILLAATVRRLTHNHTPSAQAGATHKKSQAPPTPDLTELGMILRHEINNPLTGILGNAELILAAPSQLPAEARRRAEMIVELAVRLRDLIRNLEQRLSGQADQLPASVLPRRGGKKERRTTH